VVKYLGFDITLILGKFIRRRT